MKTDPAGIWLAIGMLCVLTLLAQLIQKLRPARATAAGEST